jgi:hypothetical protein
VKCHSNPPIFEEPHDENDQEQSAKPATEHGRAATISSATTGGEQHRFSRLWLRRLRAERPSLNRPACHHQWNYTAKLI